MIYSLKTIVVVLKVRFHIRGCLLLLLTIVFKVASVSATDSKSPVSNVEKSISLSEIISDISYCYEKSKDLSVVELKKDESLVWMALDSFSTEGAVMDSGYVNVWFRFRIKKGDCESYVLDFPGAEEVRYYEFKPDGIKVHLNGKSVLKELRSFHYKLEPWILISNKELGSKYHYARVRYHLRNLDPKIYLYDAKFIHQEIIKEKFGEGVLFGVIVIVLIISVLISLTTRNITEFYYVGYVLGCFLFFLIRNSIGYQFLGELGKPLLFDTLIFVPILFAVTFYLLVISSYLQLKTRDAFWYKVFLLMILLNFIIGLMVLASGIDKVPFNRFLYSVWGVVVYLLSFVVAVKFSLKKFKSAKLLIFGNALPAIGVALTIVFGIDHQLFWVNHLLEISILIQIVLFSRAISDRVKEEIEERQLAQEKALLMLEGKVEERTLEVVKQKEIVEIANKEILDSINYARRIQSAILPPLSLVQKYIKESFILYKPKAIVAGDFYWIETVGNKVFFSVADCTGHGVPGAMISVMCSNALTRAVKELRIYKPAAILDKAVELLEEYFSKSNENMQDGMDLGLCCLDLSEGTIEYAGANNSLYFIREGELVEVKPDRQPIGRYAKRQPFTNHVLEVSTGDCFYLSSDGYADQFGGVKGKKFRYTQFRQLLKDIYMMPMAQQHIVLEKTIEAWRSNLEQLDDICVMGIRV